MLESTITPLPDPSGFSVDPLTDILRTGARRLIIQAVEAELAALLAAHADDKTEDGRSRVVRHGYLPEREVMTGIGPVPVKVPRVRDRGAGAEKVRFTSSILPPLSAQGEVDRGTAAMALPQGHFQRRFSGGARGAARSERGGAVVDHHLAAKGHVVGRI